MTTHPNSEPKRRVEKREKRQFDLTLVVVGGLVVAILLAALGYVASNSSKVATAMPSPKSDVHPISALPVVKWDRGR